MSVLLKLMATGSFDLVGQAFLPVPFLLLGAGREECVSYWLRGGWGAPGGWAGGREQAEPAGGAHGGGDGRVVAQQAPAGEDLKPVVPAALRVAHGHERQH